MLSIQNDFSNFDRVDWSTTYEVSIRFLIELLAHTYGKSPEQIIESLCLCSEDLPTFRYEEKESDNSNDPQWILLRYRTVLHTRVLLSNMLESSSWDRVPNNSISCREEIKYKGTTYPDASVVETIFETRDENSGVSEITRIVTPREKVPFADYWAYRQEIENYLIKVPAFSGWYTLLPELVATRDESAAQFGKTAEKSVHANIDPDAQPTWVLRKIPGGQWECGDESAPVKINNLMGLADMAYAIDLAGKEISPFQLPSGAAASINDFKGTLFEEPNSGIYESQGIHFGADNIADPIAQRQYKKLEGELIDDIEAATDTGNDAEQAEKEAELADLKMHMAEMTFPGGNKKLNAGDPTIKATNNARNRKETVTGKLREAGLPDMATHLHTFYKVGQKVIIYLGGPPFPDWILK